MPGTECHEDLREKRRYDGPRRSCEDQERNYPDRDFRRRGGQREDDRRPVQRSQVAEGFRSAQAPRSAGSSGRGGLRCFHCRRRGHIKEECRRLNGACLLCGSTDHWATSCPERRELRGQVANIRPPGISSVAPRRCLVCNAEGHRLEECPGVLYAREKHAEWRQEPAVASLAAPGGGLHVPIAKTTMSTVGFDGVGCGTTGFGQVSEAPVGQGGVLV